MLDSGASCNFILYDLSRALGYANNNVNSYNVRLADGKMLKTCGEVELHCKFGSYHYYGTFYVLQCDVPLILGMQFLSSVKPEIDWGSKSVFVKHKGKYVLLPSVNLNKQVVNKSSASTAVQQNNSFDGLDVDLDEREIACETHDVNKITEQLEVAPVRGKTQKKYCKCCARVLANNNDLVCQKCSNHSFVHQKRNLVVRRGKHVKTKCVQQSVDNKVIVDDVCRNDADVELVSLQQFVRGGKKKHYLNYGVVCLEEMVDNNKQNQQLNFTHRSAHGGGDDADVAHGHLQQLAKTELNRLQTKYPEVFADPVYPVDRSDCPLNFQHDIPLKNENEAPPKRKLYPLDNQELVELKQQIQVFLESNRIEPSNGPYGAPILFAKKKDGGLRMCIDYRMLNQQTVSDVFPLPRIDELLQRLDGSKVFSKLDLRDGYHQIPMNESDHVKTAFTCHYGTYQFTVMPFGLATAPSTFQRMMNRVFFDLLDNGVLCYLDDLLIYSKNVEEHKILLDKVFALLAKHKLFIKESKCHLFLEKVNFLGHVVDANGISLESGKVDAVKNWPAPTNVTQVQQFLGLCNYYRRFVLRFSELAGPMTLLTRKNQPFIWQQQQQQKSFDQLKNSLCNAPTLKVFDPALSTRVVCDASNFCVGAVLEQLHGDSWHPVEFYSKRLNQAERNYSATDREFVAIRLSLECFRQFLIGIKFLILTDHAALTYLQMTASVSRRNARWLEFLSQFQFDIKHIKGKENVVADTLSRIPGSEQLSTLQLCGLEYTLGVQHLVDLPSSLMYVSSRWQCNSVITIHENKTFLQQLLSEQQQCNSKWYLGLVKQANDGSSIYQFRNGLLCKLVDAHFCPIIPVRDSRSIEVVLSDLHSSALAGHFGQKKLLKLAQQRFYWQNMFQSVDKFCKSCAVCQANKTSTQKPAGLLQPLENPSKPFDHVSMDFIMQLPTSTRGFDAIFTIVDRFSRYVRFIPCHSNIDAEQVAALFFDHWVCHFGMPSKVISDRDVRFQSKFWQQLLKQLQCRIAMSTAYHPQSDGLTERYHRSVEQLLRCYCSSQQSDWCTLLSQCEFALNSSYQVSAGNIPFKIIYGIVPTLPLDHSLQSIQNPAVVDLVSARSSVHAQVQQSLAISRSRMEGVANPKRRDVQLAVGDRVWLSTAHLPLRLGSRKLAAKWTGPFRVRALVASEAYRLELPKPWRVHDVFHTSQLKPVRGQVDDMSPVLLDDATEEYEVETILDSRVVRGEQQFLVKWKNYDDFENTWEPRQNLKNCRQKLKQFEQRRPTRSLGNA